jgi:L-ascorbate metabolism protein UlaG (beta-lactamase superfamily)
MPKLTYLGHSAFHLQGRGGQLVIDPFLSGNPSAAARADEIKADFILLSHGHGDHLGDGIEMSVAQQATVIAPFELANYCAARGATVHPMHIGGARDFPFGRVKLTIAHHGSAAPDGTYTGNPCGFLVTLDGKTLYHPGDTGLFYDMKLIGEMNRIDVAVLPIGDNFTMGIDDAVKAAELLQPALSIPMHYNTTPMIQAEPERFVAALQSRGLKAVLLPGGETLEF